MKKLLPLFTLILCALHSLSQEQRRIDSLNRLLPSVRQDSNRVKLLNELASAYSQTEPDKTILFGSEAEKLALSLGYKTGLAEALLKIGYGHMQQEAFPLALGYFNKSLHLWEEIDDEKNMEKLHGLIAFVGERESNFPEALKHYLLQLKIVEKGSDAERIAQCKMKIGCIYDMMGNHDESIRWQLDVIRIFKETGDQLGLAQAYNNIGTAYDSKGLYDEGIKYLTLALEIAEEMQDPMGKAICLSSIGNHYQRKGDYPAALKYNLETLVLFEKNGDYFNMAASYINIGEMYTKLKKYKEAKTYLEKGRNLALQIKSKQWIANSLLSLSKAEKLEGNDGLALTYFEKYIDYRDSISNDENTRKSVQVQMQYDFDKKESASKAEQERKDARQRNIRYVITTGLIVAIVFSFVVFKQRNKIKIEKDRSEDLLLNILPAEVAEELKQKGRADAKLMEEVTVLFTDFKGFTQVSEMLTPTELVAEINECFSVFDHIMDKHGVEKIKTIGDAYMAAGGLPTANKTHAQDVVLAAIEIQQFMKEHKTKKEAEGKLFFEIRIGVHTGPVVAGIVGIKKFAYDIWGDTVNTASRMESSGEVGKVNISGTTYNLVKNQFKCEYRGKITAKGKGEIDMYFLEGRI